MNYKSNKMTQPERLVYTLTALSQLSRDKDRREKFSNILDRLNNKMGISDIKEETLVDEEAIEEE